MKEVRVKGTNFFSSVMVKNSNLERFFKSKFRSFSPAIYLIIFFLFIWIPFRDSLAYEQIKLQRRHTPSAQKGTITRDFNIIGSNREIVEFEVTTPGKIEVKAEWSGTAQTLALILNGPGQDRYYSRQDGGSPLSLTFEVTSRFLSLGKEWKLSVVNFNSRTTAQGRVQITYPAEAVSGVTIKPAEEKKEIKREMRWSAPQMRVSEPGEAHKPPSFEKSADILKPTRDFQYNSRLVKVNKRTAIPFKRFEVVDPSNGQPISPDQMLTLPNGEVISAGSYYDELNKLESGFNSLGYSLDIRRDPTESVKLQETSLSKASIARNSEKAKIIKDTHKFQAMPAPASLSAIQSDFRTRIKLDKDRLKRLKAYRLPGEPLPSPDGQTAREFNQPVQTPAYEFGYRDVFAIFLNGKAEISAGENRVEVRSEAEAGAYVFDHKVNIFRISGNTFAPSSGGVMTANLTIWVAGTPYRLVDERVSIPSVPLDQLTQIPSIDLTDEWSKSLDESFKTSFPLGPILLSAKFGVRASTGIDYGLFLCPLYARAGLGPFVASDVYAQAGIDLIIAEAGVRCTLILLDNTLKLEAGVGLDADETGLYSQAEFSIYDDLVSLSGEVDVYVCIYVPAFRLPPWRKKCWDWEIASWEGIRARGYIVEPQKMKFYIHEGGPPVVEKEELPPGESFEVTGELAGKWQPEEGSILDPDLRSQYAPPALVVYGDRLYKIWSGLNNRIIYYSSSDGTISWKQEKKTVKRYDKETGRYEEYLVTVKTPYLAWSQRQEVPRQSLTSSPIGACVYRDRLYVFHTGTYPDTSLYYRSMGRDGEWKPASGSVRIGGTSCDTHSPPAAAVFEDAVWLFFKDTRNNLIVPMLASNTVGGEDHLLEFHIHYVQALDKSQNRGGPAVCSFGNIFFLFHRDLSSENIYYRCLSKSWRPPKEDVKVQGLTSFTPPSVCVSNNRLYLFFSRKDKPISYCTVGQPPDRVMMPGPPLAWGKVREIKGSLTYEKPSIIVFKDKIFLFHMGTASNDIFYRWLEIL